MRDCPPPCLSRFSVPSSLVVSEDLTVAKHDVEHPSIAEFLWEEIVPIGVPFRNVVQSQIRSEHRDV